jgi:hypothetical protein
MEPPDELPPEEKKADGEQESPGSPPYYEYVSPSDASPAQEEGSAQAEGNREQDFIYPPPPSYYQNMSVMPERQPLPGQPQTLQPTQQGRQERSGRTPGQPFAGYGEQYHTPPGMQTGGASGWYPPPGKSVRRSRKQTWIILSIIAVCVLLLCGGGGWAIYNVAGAIFQQVNGATQVVQDFYTHVQQQDYAGAFEDLQLTGETADDFTKKAQAVDQQYGILHSFSVGISSLSSNSSANSNAWQVTVQATRSSNSYPVIVSVESINGTWKIVDLDLNRF